tara:strand:+ start:104 stop:286 length:183 start_codon:yes stop_codon:yes gene_type:complete
MQNDLDQFRQLFFILYALGALNPSNIRGVEELWPLFYCRLFSISIIGIEPWGIFGHCSDF